MPVIKASSLHSVIFISLSMVSQPHYPKFCQRHFHYRQNILSQRRTILKTRLAVKTKQMMKCNFS